MAFDLVPGESAHRVAGGLLGVGVRGRARRQQGARGAFRARTHFGRARPRHPRTRSCFDALGFRERPNVRSRMRFQGARTQPSHPPPGPSPQDGRAMQPLRIRIAPLLGAMGVPVAWGVAASTVGPKALVACDASTLQAGDKTYHYIRARSRPSSLPLVGGRRQEQRQRRHRARGIALRSATERPMAQPTVPVPLVGAVRESGRSLEKK